MLPKGLQKAADHTIIDLEQATCELNDEPARRIRMRREKIKDLTSRNAKPQILRAEKELLGRMEVDVNTSMMYQCASAGIFEMTKELQERAEVHEIADWISANKQVWNSILIDTAIMRETVIGCLASLGAENISLETIDSHIARQQLQEFHALQESLSLQGKGLDEEEFLSASFAAVLNNLTPEQKKMYRRMLSSLQTQFSKMSEKEQYEPVWFMLRTYILHKFKIALLDTTSPSSEAPPQS